MGVNAKELRTEVAGQLIAELMNPGGPIVAAVFDHFPKDLGGKSPAITTEIGPITLSSTPDEPNWVGLTFILWALREDADTAEDQLDTVRDAFIDCLEKHFNVRWLKPTMPGYEVDGGKVYRIEEHTISFEWW